MNSVSLSIRQAADATGVSETTIRNAVNKGADHGGLAAKRIGSKIIIPVENLKNWIDSLENANQK